ncbi:ATP-binding protein [Candidatus Babeliales bacterium]|nr:ATP-binding protein [Candidatus Babeliales bacterium]MBP9843708.1 ATP-binding protein [Candidatus Babeliales bacterium]
MKRTIYLKLIQQYFSIFSVCAILGPRQVGKTTLAHEYVQQYGKDKVEFFDLENPLDLARLENPMLAFKKYENYLIVIDEIQRRPELFPVLRVLVDTKKYNFLILGSASRDLLKQSSETLAGRIGYIQLPSFTFFDITSTLTTPTKNNLDITTEIVDRLIIRGGFPLSYLATSDEQSALWRREYINTFLERDLPSFGFNVLPPVMYRFWMMLCFYHGQTINISEISKSLMLSNKIVNHYLDILAGTFMIRILQPWFENIKKRQVKTPKIYFRDSGIFNSLSQIYSIQELSKNPRIGSLWEGFALEQVISCFQFQDQDCYFWSTANEAELDLLVFKNGKRFGFEFKYTDNPKTTKSMHIALQDLKLDHLYVIYPGNKSFPMHEKITAYGFMTLEELRVDPIFIGLSN